MKWSKASRITAIVCGTLFAMSVLAASVLSGTQIDATKIFEILMSGVGGILIGLGVASKTKHVPMLLLVCFVTVGSMSCSIFKKPDGSIDPCRVQQSIVAALDIGIQSLDAIPGTDSPAWQDAKKYSQGVVQLGHAATRGCELTRDGAAWQNWVQMGLEVTMAIIAQFGGASEELPANPPPELRRAFLLLGAEANGPQIETHHEEPPEYH